MGRRGHRTRAVSSNDIDSLELSKSNHEFVDELDRPRGTDGTKPASWGRAQLAAPENLARRSDVLNRGRVPATN
jgi:hypothetical protein